MSVGVYGAHQPAFCRGCAIEQQAQANPGLWQILTFIDICAKRLGTDTVSNPQILLQEYHQCAGSSAETTQMRTLPKIFEMVPGIPSCALGK